MRVVGEVYWGDWIYNEASTDTDEWRIKYRVVEIVQVMEHDTFGKLIPTERLEAIEIEKRPRFLYETYRGI